MTRAIPNANLIDHENETVIVCDGVRDFAVVVRRPMVPKDHDAIDEAMQTRSMPDYRKPQMVTAVLPITPETLRRNGQVAALKVLIELLETGRMPVNGNFKLDNWVVIDGDKVLPVNLVVGTSFEPTCVSAHRGDIIRRYKNLLEICKV